MRVTLKDYQHDAVAAVLSQLGDARDFYKTRNRVSSVALTATTGSGKTVMAAAVIEALFWGSDEFGVEPDPGAVVLWFSDDPALNEQAKHRLRSASEQLRHHVVTVEHPFRYEKLQPKMVYFLNTSKLSKNSLLVRGADDLEQTDEDVALLERASVSEGTPFTFWDTLRNTIEDEDLTLYMVFDEAHRGMGKRPSEKPTIVKRLINGQRDVPAMPIVWGISATVKRFEKAMSEAQVEGVRVHLGTVEVDPVRVQESGLLKDNIVLDFPAETGDFNTVLLRRGVRKLKQMSQAWEQYGYEQREEPVVPLMVLQVPNKPKDEDVTSALDVVFDEWPELPRDSVAHVFGEHSTQHFGRHSVPYISPEQVEDAKFVRVLLAKDAISTGWDCPRAEVMVSFRPAEDDTYITQLLGRMIRTPLARRIEGDDVLNSVECILPRFNKKNAHGVIERIHGQAESGDGGTTGQRVLVDPVLMTQNPQLPVEVWECFERMPAQTLPRKHANPIKRLTQFAQALATDGLVPDAGKIAHAKLHGVLNGLAAQYKTEFEAARQDVLTASGTTVTHLARHGLNQEDQFEELADDRAIMDAYRSGARLITPDVARTYVDSIAEESGGDEEAYREAHIHAAAIARLPQTRPALDAEALRLAEEWHTVHRVAIKSLPEGRQSLYAEIIAMTTEPQMLGLALPKNRQEETKKLEDGHQTVLDRRGRHLLVDEEGLFPIGKLSPDEVEVLDRELQRDATIAWYRNPTGGRDSMSIAYQDRHGEWRTLRPDFVFFVNTSQGVRPSIVDPHGHHLPDAVWKLHGMARFAEHYGDQFHRIEAISRLNGELRVLDFTLAEVRERVLQETDAYFAYDRWSQAYV